MLYINARKYAHGAWVCFYRSRSNVYATLRDCGIWKTRSARAGSLSTSFLTYTKICYHSFTMTNRFERQLHFSVNTECWRVIMIKRTKLKVIEGKFSLLNEFIDNCNMKHPLFTIITAGDLIRQIRSFQSMYFNGLTTYCSSKLLRLSKLYPFICIEFQVFYY